MKYKYEIYNCNNGNPTAIITNCTDEKIYKKLSEEIYKTNKNVDQVAVILDVKDNTCTFKLVNGEFCGNACLSISAYMYNNYKTKDITIINKIKKDNQEVDIEIKSIFNNNTGNLIIPKGLFLPNNKCTNLEDYKVEMNGITHYIIPNSYGDKNEEFARSKIQEMEENNTIKNILGIIFLENNKIDPFIWINRIKLLQHQDSCLSGSIAALEYLETTNNIKESDITQPTGESYNIKFKENYIDITGTVRKVETKILEVE